MNSIQRVLRRVQNEHKGWHYIDTEYVNKEKPRIFKYKIRDPNNKLICFERINKFASENNLSKHSLSCMLRGKIKCPKHLFYFVSQ